MLSVSFSATVLTPVDRHCAISLTFVSMIFTVLRSPLMFFVYFYLFYFSLFYFLKLSYYFIRRVFENLRHNLNIAGNIWF